MKKHLLTLLCIMWFGTSLLHAQNLTVTGQVTAKDDGKPIIGASVGIKGTTTGTQTNINGRFTLSVPTGSSLTITYIGYTTQTVAVTGPTLNVVLNPDTKQLGEVVVTGALGITRTRNQQAYAAQQVSGEEVSKTRSSNFIEGMAGKVSGVEIRQTNGLGSSTNVVIRGSKSIANSNQALFVVDGVPFNNGAPSGSTINSSDQRTGRGGYDYGSPVQDVNPDNIESVTVLKGAAASALYGSQGANGVILITTKKAKKGLGIVINTGVSVGSIDKSTFAKYQKEYGGGYGPYYEDDSGYFWSRDVNGDGQPDLITPLTEDASYGARFDPNLKVYQWNAFYKGLPTYGQATPWVAAANDPSTFFEKPVSNNQSIFITNANDNGSFKLGYTRNNDTGILPNSNIQKNAVNLAGSYNITNKLTASGSVDYTRTDGLGRYGTGYQSENVVGNFRQWWQVNTDIKQLKNAYYNSLAQGETGNATWNLSNFNDPTAIYWDNPYFGRYQNYETDNRNRYFGNVALNYKATNWLNILGRVTVDNWNQIQDERRAVGTTGVSSYSNRRTTWNETDYDLIATVNKNFGNDVNFKAVAGTNIRKQRYQDIFTTTNGGLVVPLIYALSNSQNTPDAPIEADQPRQVNGIYAGATLTYKNTYTLDGTLRRDVSSTLPKGNNTYYYPAVSAGFVFSELMKDQNWLSYGKLRANYAEVGNDAPIFSTIDYYTIGTPINGAPQTSVNATKNNPNLKPERTTSSEFGAELQFFNGRLGFDGTYYVNKTVDQIIPVTISSATGYSAAYLNSGTVQNKGIELTLNGSPIRSKDFSWKIDLNFTKNNSKVLELFKDATGQQAQNLQLGSFQGGVTINATLGQPLGTIRGTDFIYKDGQKVVGDDGYYLQTSTANNVIGNSNPKWIGGINNSFRYKNFTLSFLIDIRKGGSVFSLDTYYGFDTGLYPETAGLNDLGNPSRSPIAQGGGVILKGVKENGQPNDVRVENTGSGLYGYELNPNAAFVYDAGYVKLRQALISYSFPQNIVRKLGPVKGIDLSLIGRNLWIIHKNLPYADPEESLSSGNLQGYQSGAYPTVRTFALNAKFTF
ncbi:MAG: SusC/RagA family TonB-linked outer membrane protein [Mucilaginibacter sp.]|nr:SusC/RagA family TonB-linked outer membrane protein [Mucilaginibacter sp.]